MNIKEELRLQKTYFVILFILTCIALLPLYFYKPNSTNFLFIVPSLLLLYLISLRIKKAVLTLNLGGVLKVRPVLMQWLYCLGSGSYIIPIIILLVLYIKFEELMIKMDKYKNLFPEELR